MTHPERHRIERQVIELAIGAGAHAPALQEAVARSLRERAAPELQAVFDRAAGPHELLRLDRLEIDLGRITGGDWEPQFRHRLVEELTRGLAQFRPVSQAPARGQDDAPAAGALQQFLFFLAHGRLPWWGGRPAGGWSDALAPAMDAVAWAALRKALRDDPRARARFVHACADAFLERAVTQWADLPHASRVLQQLSPAGLPEAARPRWRRDGWMLVLAWALAAEAPVASGAALLRDLLALRRQFARDERAAGAPGSGDDVGADPAGALVSAADLPQPWRGWMAVQRDPQRGTTDATQPHAGGAVVHPFARASSAPADRREGRDSPATAPAGQGAIVVPLRATASQRLADSRPAATPTAAGEAIYLAGAGAILLHPFLEQLFRASGLLAGRDFRDAEARTRAVLLLGLLTFGSAEVPEHELLLPKLLCGCPFEEPLEPIALDADDAERCDALLRAVLAHWNALHSTSPHWLRGQFLLREGKLEGVDEGVRLTVERRAQDVLLARMPWGMGVVVLPWLRQRIFVHWLQ